MKKFVLILKIFVLLVLLMAIILAGCTESSVSQTVNNVVVSKNTAMVGEEVKLTVRSTEFGWAGCTKLNDFESPGLLFQWGVEPSNGAMVKNGVFVASKPGTYVVSPENGPLVGKGSTTGSATIIVQGKAVETTAAETTAAETTAAEATTATTTKPSDTITETNETTAESDANLIHGVVPIQVTIKENQTDEWGKFEVYTEFWNVGKLGGEQYAKATLKQVLIEKAEGIQGPENGYTSIYEGTFTGGPNGDFNLSSTFEGPTIKIHFKLKDGKEIISDDGTSSPINDPEVLEAFKGWVD